jgi:hypothetical protein
MRLGVLAPAPARALERLPCGLNLKNQPKQHNNAKGLQSALSSAGVSPAPFFFAHPARCADFSNDERLRAGRIAHGIEAAQHGLFVRAQPLHEPWIVQRGLAVRRAHLLQSV